MIEAVVQTGRFETAYRRAGSGATVLLLVGAPAGEDGSDWLFDRLADRFRIIAPALPPGLGGGDGDGDEPDDFDGWLRGLVDGLGLEQPAIVAAATHARALLRFAVRDPHRLDRLAFVAPGAPGAWSEPGLTEAVGSVAHPVLLLAIPPEDGAVRADALAELIGFLATPAPDGQAPPGSRMLS